MDLGYYGPSYSMIQAFKADFNDESLIAAGAKFAEYLRNQQLSSDNFCMVMRMLLSIEDITTMHFYSLLEETANLNAHIQHIYENVYKIMIRQTKMNPEAVLTEDIDQLVLVPRESLEASIPPKHIIYQQFPHIHETLKNNDPMRREVGTITELKRTSVTFECNSEYIFKKKYAKVIFRSTRFPIRLMYYTLSYLRATPTIRRYLFPSATNQLKNIATSEMDISVSFPLLNTSIATNVEQLQAVRQIINGPSTLAPYIIFGPPGTGKTVTIAEAILQIYLRGSTRVIVTAGSNSACDTIALKLCECIEQSNRFIYDRNLPNRAVVRVYSEKRSLKELKLIHPLIWKNSNAAEIVASRKAKKWRKGKSNKKANKKQQEDIYLDPYRIIVATLCKVATMRGFLNKSKIEVSHIFIDEAAASCEPETILGIVGIKQEKCHVILSGDHKQLGPVIKSKRAAALGLSQSLMGRLMASAVYQADEVGNYDCTLQSRLRRNYRSHAEIVGLFNKLYYNSELIPLAPVERVNRAANWHLLSDAQFPIVFQQTLGKTQRQHLSYSSYNELEAQEVAWYVWILLKKGLGNGIEVRAEDIGVITPYLAQCALLKQKLGHGRQRQVKVGTVESFQGRENPIIIVSFVCSFMKSAFLFDPRRLNVLLSRAMSLLILIGNPLSLSQSPDLEHIIEQCKSHGHLLSKEGDREKLRNKDKCEPLSTQMFQLSLADFPDLDKSTANSI